MTGIAHVLFPCFAVIDHEFSSFTRAANDCLVSYHYHPIHTLLSRGLQEWYRNLNRQKRRIVIVTSDASDQTNIHWTCQLMMTSIRPICELHRSGVPLSHGVSDLHFTYHHYRSESTLLLPSRSHPCNNQSNIQNSNSVEHVWYTDS